MNKPTTDGYLPEHDVAGLANDLTETERLQREWMRARWDDFCNCDPVPDGFLENMEAAGWAELRPVIDEDLEEAFAAELGIEKGGSVWALTKAGVTAFEEAGCA